MNKILLSLVIATIFSGCTKVTEYVATIIPALKEEPEFVQVKAQSLCPAEKPHAQVLEGVCEGGWSFTYDSTSKIYTCSYIHSKTLSCPAGSVSIGHKTACGHQIDQYTKETVSNNAKCETLFKNESKVAYRLVCCT